MSVATPAMCGFPTLRAVITRPCASLSVLSAHHCRTESSVVAIRKKPPTSDACDSVLRISDSPSIGVVPRLRTVIVTVMSFSVASGAAHTWVMRSRASSVRRTIVTGNAPGFGCVTVAGPRPASPSGSRFQSTSSTGRS